MSALANVDTNAPEKQPLGGVHRTPTVLAYDIPTGRFVDTRRTTHIAFLIPYRMILTQL